MNSGPSRELQAAQAALGRVEAASLTNAAEAGRAFARAVFAWMVAQERKGNG